jgi:hypothetical protein
LRGLDSRRSRTIVVERRTAGRLAAGATHWRTILLDLGATSAIVSAWNAPILQ